MDLLEWWNAPFALVFAFAVLWSIGSQFFEGDHGDGDADSEHDFGVEHHTAEVDVQHGPALFTQALYAVGFGRVPLSVFIGVFLFSWSLLGWASNIVWSVYIWDQPEVFFWFSLGLACVGGLVSTNFSTRFLSKFLPQSEYFTLSTADLVGKLGTTRYKITRDTGSVDVRDESGSLITVMCIVDDDTSPIEGGVEVVLWKYEPDRNVFYVTPYNEVNELVSV